MSDDPLATFVELLERTACDVALRMRPAPQRSIDRLRSMPHSERYSTGTLSLPPEYVRFLELMGGNHRGELMPFMPDDEFHVDHAIASHIAPLRDPDEDDPVYRPDGWVFLCQRFEHDLPSYRLHLAPRTTDVGRDPAGRWRVVHGSVDVAGHQTDIAHHGTLEELLLTWLFQIRFASRASTLTFPMRRADGTDAGVHLEDVLVSAAFRTVAGGRPGDWFRLLEHDDGSWVWLQQNPIRMTRFGLLDFEVRAPTMARQSSIWQHLHREAV